MPSALSAVALPPLLCFGCSTLPPSSGYALPTSRPPARSYSQASRYAPTALNEVKSEVLSATKETGSYATDTRIDVRVRATGPAFGYFQSAYLSFWGSFVIDDKHT